MARAIDYRRAEVYISEICAYHVDYDCRETGKHLLILPQEEKIIFILVCEEHVLNYLREGWLVADPALFEFKWDNPIRIKEVEDEKNL